MRYPEVVPLLDDATLARFSRHVDRSGSCWHWTGRKFASGYGMFDCFDVNLKTKRKTTSHRIAYMIANGGIEAGLLVCHHCDNRPCVRPDHLFAGTQSMNLQDAIRKGRFHNIARGKPLVGERNPLTSLSSDDVTAIKVLSNRGMGNSLISQIFRTTENTIIRILSGRSWKYHAKS